MSEPSRSMRDMARRLIEASRSGPFVSTKNGESPARESLEACERLRQAVSQFAGPEGFAALIRRALTLARVEFPTLRNVRLSGSLQLEGLEEVAGGEEEGAGAAIALVAHLLELLVTFIGEELTRRLVLDGWPSFEAGPENGSKKRGPHEH